MSDNKKGRRAPEPEDAINPSRHDGASSRETGSPSPVSAPYQFLSMAPDHQFWSKPEKVLAITNGDVYLVVCYELRSRADLIRATGWATFIFDRQVGPLIPSLYFVGPPINDERPDLREIAALNDAGAIYLDRDRMLAWAATVPGLGPGLAVGEVLEKQLRLDFATGGEQTAAERRETGFPPPNPFPPGASGWRAEPSKHEAPSW